MSKVAVIQKPPVLLDRARTIEGTLASIEEAVTQGASLLVFPRGLHPRLSDLDLATEARRGWRALRRNPFHGAVFLDDAMQIDGLSVDLGGNQVLGAGGRSQLDHPDSRANADGTAVNKSDAKTIHEGKLKNGRHGQD